jgi:prolyl-tRNA synthetase
LKQTDIRVHIDLRDNYNPGWKFNHWELKGVPIRLEIGPKDVENQEVKAVVRFNGDKSQIKWNALPHELPIMLENIQELMYQRALQRFNEKAKQANNW